MNRALSISAALLLVTTACGDGGLSPTNAAELATPQAEHVIAGYTATPLPTRGAPPGFSAGQVFAINNSGTAVGWVRGPSNEFQAAMWSGGERFELPALAGGATSEARDINLKGEIVGSSETADGEMRAVVWRDGVPEDLGTLGGSFSSARGINDRGQVVGVSETAEGEQRAFLWTDGHMEDLGHLPGTEASVAVGINRQGEVVGYSLWGTVVQRATLWRNGETVDLGTLGHESGAFAINERSQIVGGSFPLHQTETRAVLWERGEIRDLGSLDDSFSSASDINDRSQIVGTTRAPDCWQCAFLWEKGEMRILPSPEESLASASGINGRGDVVGLADGPVVWRRGPARLVAGAAGLAPSADAPMARTGSTTDREGTTAEGRRSPPWAETVCSLAGGVSGPPSALEVAAGC